MIDKKQIEDLLNEKLENEAIVLVELKVSANNNIRIFLDSFDGIPISKCVEISRHVEHGLDRDKEDFELEVSSYSIVKPFILPLHYQKNTGRKVEVQVLDKKPIAGILHSVQLSSDEQKVDYIEILQSKKIKPEGKKKKIEVKEIHKIEGSEIKQCKLVSLF